MKYSILISEKPRIVVSFDDSVRPRTDELQSQWRKLNPTQMLELFGIVADDSSKLNSYLFRPLYKKYFVKSVSYGLYQARNDIREILYDQKKDVDIRVKRTLKTIPYWMAKYLKPINHPLWKSQY